MRYTEPGIRVITVFFAALVGFGLKHLADVTEHSAPDIYPDQFSYFILAALLFLRFLTGSANHLWCEYIRTDAGEYTWSLGFDLLALTVYGIIAVLGICYAENLEDFLYWSAVLLFAAAVWSVLDSFFCEQKGWCWGWLIINIVQGLAIVGVAKWLTEAREPYFDHAWWQVILFPVYFVCLVLDFRFQVHVLKTKTETESTENSDGAFTMRLTAPNGDVVTFEDSGKRAAVFARRGRDGTLFEMTYQGKSDEETAGTDVSRKAR